MSTGISLKAHERLKKYLHLEGGEVEIYNVFEQLVRPDERILEMSGTDIYAVVGGPPRTWKLKLEEDEDSYTYLDEWGVGFKMAKKGGWCYYMVGHPLAEVKSVEELKDYPWPDPYDPGITEGLEERVRQLYENTDYALLMCSPSGGIFAQPQALRGFDTFLVDMVLNPKLAEAVMDKVLEYHIGFWDHVLSRIGGFIQIAQVNDDLGSEQGPLISLDLYRRLLRPREKELYQFIKKKANVSLFMHTCGSISEFIPDFIDLGVDILNPVQVSAKNMDTRELKERFGQSITFWGGGIDTQRVLPRGTVKEVEEEVKKRIADLAPGGGFVFSQVHNITPEVPPENIVAMYDAVKKYGKYPLSRALRR